jgi:hypothetical protein
MALARQTKAIPIVFANFFDPVGSGLVGSLARLGGINTHTARMLGLAVPSSLLGRADEIID